MKNQKKQKPQNTQKSSWGKPFLEKKGSSPKPPFPKSIRLVNNALGNKLLNLGILKI